MKNLKSKLGDEAALDAMWEGILLNSEFAAARDYLLPTWEGGQGAEVGTLSPGGGLYKRDGLHLTR